MADIRVSGTRVVTRQGPTTIKSPARINLDSTNTVATGNLTVENTATILKDIEVLGTWTTLIIKPNDDNVDNPIGRPYDPDDIFGDPEQRRAGAVYVGGGVGIEKDLNVGGYIYGRISKATTSLELLVTSTNIDEIFYPIFTPKSDGSAEIFSDKIGEDPVNGGLRYNPGDGKLYVDKIQVSSTLTSVSPTTGALTVAGGAGIKGEVNLGSNLNVTGEVASSGLFPNQDKLYDIGSQDAKWAEAFLEKIYTKIITSTTGSNIQINPAAGLTEVLGDLRVLGNRPIGTAPVVTNILYVTVDGNDTNDGRAMDPSRACRTVTGAVNSPYFQPGTQIRVAPGFYLEDNPIRLKPYTSVMGSDIRTTFIEPINKTQDLFHVDSGCYIAFCTFLNGRSGLLEGPYESGFNRGAYATAFPPLEGDERIDLFHSPYIQNCTNLSGPWLKDGTMFIPNQTVQVPAAVGVGTWPENTASIVVTVPSGSITTGMYVNAGQQNQGFFDARTLMLANKQFLQEQVVTYVDKTFSTSTFVYNQSKCLRDTGLIIDSIAIDLLQESTSESIFAGLQYWSQSGYVDAIGDQITTTTAAINYVKNLATSTVELIGGPTVTEIVKNRFDDILNIINSGTAGITDTIVSNSTATTDSAIVNSYQTLLNEKQNIISQTINYIDTIVQPFTYDQTKCSRDTGFIVDALVLDLLFNGTSQSNFAGLQYWNQTSYVGGIANEITTTTNTINYVNELAQKVIQNITTGTRYQTEISQNLSLEPGSPSEATTINTNFNYILTILNNGTVGVSDIIIPNGITESTNLSVKKSYALLQANKEYIKAEAIAFVETTKTSGFTYDQTKCARDVGYMIDSISFDLLYGGNKQSVQSGVYYYGYTTVTEVPGEIPQVIAAYNYIKEILPNIIRNIPLSLKYQTTVTQVSGTAGSSVEVFKAQENIDFIIDIIKNGPSVANEPSPISLVRSLDANVNSAASILYDNRSFIRAEIIAYVNTLKLFLFDKEKCKRDIGYMIDSVAFDLLHGGNKQSIKSGVYYYNYDVNSTEIPNEIPQTTAAYNFIKSIVDSIVQGKSLISVYQTGTVQITNLPTATPNEVEKLKEKIDIITNIIRTGPNSVDARIPIRLDTTPSSGALNAYNLLMANREFIKQETISYINKELINFNYSREKCFRDVGILVENVAYDAAFGGNEKTVESGLAYYDGVVSRIAGQETQTTAAIDYLNELCQKIIVNNTCTDLLSNGVTTTAQYNQIRNLVLTNGGIASKSISSMFNIINNIILKGPESAPFVYKSTGPDAAFVSAEVLMQANRKLIQQDTVNYINNLTLTFPYSEMKCKRDTGLIIDSIAFDLLYPTPDNSQSTFAGLQYWNQENYVGDIENQLAPTVDAIRYLKELSIKIIQNITPGDDLIPRYQNTFTQVTLINSATEFEVEYLNGMYDIILDIVGGNNKGWTDRIISNFKPIELPSIDNACELLFANKEYMSYEVTAYVDAVNSGFSYDVEKCRRDIGHIITSVAFDLKHGGNKQSIQTGLYYYGFTTSTIAIRNQEIQTTAAFNYLNQLAVNVIRNIPVIPLQEEVKQVLNQPLASLAEVNKITSLISTITNIINSGTSVAAAPSAISFTATNSITALNAFNSLYANKEFMITEVITYIDKTYNPNKFNYNEEKCYRDVGLIVDAVSQDILLGGNQKSIEAGLSYWSAGYNYISGQETTTTLAINYARDIALEIIANKPVKLQTNTNITQIINPFFKYGGDYMPQEAVKRNFNIITTIIERGPLYAPPVYAGGGLFALTGLNGADVKIAPKVISVKQLTANNYLIGLDQKTIGFGINSTLYFGDTFVFPLNNSQVEERSLEYTGNSGSWNQRKVDPIGSMGGSLVDGSVISSRSPIQSFVYDAFTQITQGGRGVHITNDGYAQLVSVFTIFCSIGVQVDNGGIASIVNSNANFGDICLLAKGYGKRKFSGTIYNPSFKAYPESPGNDGLNQYYPIGFWPNNARVMVYCPDLEDRPHISLVMEVVPPEGHLNEQLLPGFLNAAPNKATLTTGSIVITDIDTDGIAIGNFLYIRDQENNRDYVDTGTFVTDVGFRSVTLSKALVKGGGDINNDNFFDLYFCGNAYYTVLSSEVGENPKYNRKNELIVPGTNILSTASTGLEISQIPAHIDALKKLNEYVKQVISNVPVTVTPLEPNPITLSQKIIPLVIGGANANQFIDQRFDEMIRIIGAPDLTAAENVIPTKLRTKTGLITPGAGSAINLISENIEFLADKISAYVNVNIPGSLTTFDETTCRRDADYIIDGAFYDIALGTNYNAVTCGLAYQRTVSSEVTSTQLVQTLSAINFIKNRISTISQVSSNEVAVQRNANTFNEIADIIFNADAAADALVFPEPTGVSSNKINAKNQLIANKNFIKAEIIAWINYQIENNLSPFTTSFVYNSTKCARDVGYIVDALCYDILYGGNSASVTCARAYFEGASTVIPGETSQTAAALQKLSLIVQDIVVENLVTTTSGNNENQITTGFAASSTEASELDTLIQITRSAIIDGSLVNLPAVLNPDVSWTDIGLQSAVAAIFSLKSTIIGEMIAYINTLGTAYPYDETLCRRDSGYIIEGVYRDIALGTNYNAITCGNAYQRSVSAEVTATQLAQTLTAINYIKGQSALSLSASEVAVNRSNVSFNEIMDIILNGEDAADALVLPSPVGVDINKERAKNQLIANKNFIKAEIIAWINYQIENNLSPFTTSFVYNSTKCARDVGYIVDALCYDILYGGNSASVDAARAYFEGASTVIPGETSQTAAALQRLSSVVQDIIQEIIITKTTGNILTQNTAGSAASSTEASSANTLIQIIRSVIVDGDLSSLPAIDYPSISWVDANIQSALAQLLSDKSTIIDNMIVYINDEFSGAFEYDSIKCQRDVKIILQRLIYDIETGGRYNSVMTGLSYWNRTGTHHIVQLGENVRRNDLFPDGSTVNFYQRSYMSASGYVFEYVGAGTNYGALPQVGRADPVQGRETVQLNSGKVFFTSTDQNGDFRIGPGLVISQATGVLSGRTFTKSLFANMTPFILAIESGGG